jgi:anti-anti-sigma regulatory factor
LSDDLDNGKDDTKLVKNTIQYIILDCQMISHIDLSGITILSQIIKEYRLVYIDILMVKCSPCFIKTLTSADFFEKFPSDFVFYDITDALHFINKEKEESSL